MRRVDLPVITYDGQMSAQWLISYFARNGCAGGGLPNEDIGLGLRAADIPFHRISSKAEHRGSACILTTH
jgi:hypothetical protein